MSMRLYLIHCGFYDEEISEGIYEFHVNIPVAAADVEAAKKLVRADAAFQRKKMHIDGIQEVKIVGGYRVDLVPSGFTDVTTMENHLHRDL